MNSGAGFLFAFAVLAIVVYYLFTGIWAWAGDLHLTPYPNIDRIIVITGSIIGLVILLVSIFMSGAEGIATVIFVAPIGIIGSLAVIAGIIYLVIQAFNLASRWPFSR